MGGTTVFLHGQELEPLLREATQRGVDGLRIGLYPDTELVVIRRAPKFTAIYRANLIPDGATPHDMEFVEAEKGDVGKAIAWAKHFTEREDVDDDEFIVCIHLHT